MVDPTSIESLNQSANQAEDRAIALAGSSASLADKLRDAVAERFQESPIAQQRDVALKNYITTAPNARAELADTVRSGTILNPNQQQAIIASKQAANVVPLLSLNDLLTAQFGTMNDIIGGGVRGLEAQNQAAQAAATIARNRANTAFDQSIKERELALKSAESGPSVLDQLIMNYILGQQDGQGQTVAQTTQSEPKPTAIPSAEFQQRISGKINSPLGQWSFNRVTQSWQPSSIPEAKYSIGQKIYDDETGQTLIFDGKEWVEPGQYNPGLLRSIFGGL